MELRCANRLHGVATHASGNLEVVCRSALCGKRQGVVVVHYFDLATGSCTTKQYRELPIRKDVNESALGHRSTVRST
jgi:hypothetical protein